jgi:glycosyltransferase involved in cell wall biosynthesis
MIKPKISVLIPTYNRGHLIAETLESILAQTFSSWECIIVDDNSSDNTAEVIERYLQDIRFKFITKPKDFLKGANSSRNYGLELSRGEYIYWFDSDDIIHPLTFEICMNEFSKSSIDFCRFQRAMFFDDFDNKNFENYNRDENVLSIDKYQIEKIINNDLPFNTCSLMWRKESLGSEKFNDKLLYAEEWEYYCRLVSNNLKGSSINKVLIYARKHADSQTHEFNISCPIRVEAKREAALLIVKNLKEKTLIDYSITRYFVVMSRGHYDSDFFKQLMVELECSGFDYIRWRLFYFVLPLRFKITRLKK